MPRPRAAVATAVPNAPDWLTKATGPADSGSSAYWLKVKGMRAKALVKPNVFQAHITVCHGGARSGRAAPQAACRTGPVSPNPELHTMATFTPLAPSAASASLARLAGNPTTPRSGVSGSESTSG